MGNFPTFEDFCLLASERARKQPNERTGQAAFNMLTQVNDALAEKVRGTSYDPFYDDSRLADFYGFLSQNWR